MKLFIKNVIISLIVFVMLLSHTLQTRSKLRLKTRSKKFYTSAKSQMLLDLFKAPGSPKPASEAEDLLKREVKKDFDSKYANVVAEDWLSISSPDFKDEGKFPVFNYPQNGIGEPLITLHEYTRINERFVNRPTNLSSDQPYEKDPDSPPKGTVFWFRLSGKYLYYNESKKSVNTLGNFRWIDDTAEAKIVTPKCFKLVDKRGAYYKYCAETIEIMKKFICYIQQQLRFDVDSKCYAKRENIKESKPSKIVERIVTQPYILIPMARNNCNDGWNYRNNGLDWECLCKEGMLFILFNKFSRKKAITN